MSFLNLDDVRYQNYNFQVTEFNAGNWLGCIRNHDFGCMAGYGEGNVRFFYKMQYLILDTPNMFHQMLLD